MRLCSIFCTANSPALQVAKKVVRGDYKNGPVKDPTAKILPSHEKRIKNCVHEYMSKAVRTAEERRKAKASRSSISRGNSKEATPNTPQYPPKDHDSSTPKANHDISPTDSTYDLKRKREEHEEELTATPHSTSPKRSRTASETLPSAPPPPPPPPETTDTEEASLTPMYDGPATSKAAAFQLDGYGSPMQLATPPTNGSGGDQTAHNIHGSGGGGSHA